MKKKGKIALGIILLFSTLVAFTPPTDRYFEIQRNLDIFATLYKEVNMYYVDDVNPNKLMKTGIDAMLRSLDPYTDYIPEDEIGRLSHHDDGSIWRDRFKCNYPIW